MRCTDRCAMSCLSVMYLIRSSWTSSKVNELGQDPPVAKEAFGSLCPGSHASCQIVVGPEELVSPFWQWDDAPR